MSATVIVWMRRPTTPCSDCRAGRLVEEVGQQDAGQPRRSCAGRQPPQAHGAEQQSKALAGTAGRVSGAVAVACAPPDQGVRDAPAVQRKRRHEVEHEHEHVDRRQPAQPNQSWRRPYAFFADRQLGEGRAAGQQSPGDDAGDDHRKRHQRASRGDAELRLGIVRLLGARDAAERPQVDAGDLQTAAPCDQRVAELVQHQRGEEREHRRHGDEIGGRTRAAELAVEDRRDEQDEHEQHDEPADADAHADAEDAGQLEIGTRRHSSDGRASLRH